MENLIQMCREKQGRLERDFWWLCRNPIVFRGLTPIQTSGHFSVSVNSVKLHWMRDQNTSWVLFTCTYVFSRQEYTGVDSLPLLQGIFPTQESNQGLLHCRWVLYQMSYQGRPPYWARYPIGSFAWYLLPVHLTTYNDTYWDMSRRQQGCRRRGDLVFPLCFLFLWTSPKCFSTLRAVLSWSSSWIQLAFFSNTWRASFIKSHPSLRL